ncbi:hypothetical protein LEN26_001487 [Aphanomyces euteiches]|nr:hypothetical protein AeMF1_018212 [Aphanomyces euteiches]KAH9161296.1 hypothetical protein LEN26_001487 [Aphanomyces euteiches]KAH9182280.1 hypothetical protein AeNC1_015746 [Aphanomyces euteiches]
MGHRGGKATAKALKDVFYWSGMDDDVKMFVKNCLQCMCIDGEMVPRPMGEALHAVEPNQLIHCDFFTIPGGYVHVIVDDASRFCQLTWHDGCKAVDAVESMQQWFATFGIVRNWMSDQGPHFKNEIMFELRRIYGAAHKFTPAYCPWVNGSVEVMMRSLRKTLRTMLTERKRDTNEAHILLPVVQHALNNTPSDTLGGLAPITAMMQRPPENALSAYLADGKVEEIDSETLKEWQAKLWSELATARDQLHRVLSKNAEKKRAKERGRRNKDDAKLVRYRHLEVSDYVLVGKVSAMGKSKLHVSWLGPRRIIKSYSDWLFDVEDLRDGTKSQHHASRLKHYAVKEAGVTQNLLDHVAYVEGGHIVEELRECKFDKALKRWVILVKWRGLEEIENTWEPVDNLLEDVSSAVKAFMAHTKAKSANTRAMIAAVAALSSGTHA